MKTLLIDWGIGGLSVYRELKSAAPGLSCVYISDAGFTPYGKASVAQLTARLHALVDGARELWAIERAVIACNAASTILDADDSAVWPVPVSGVIEPGLRIVRESGFKKVGVIGGLRTVESRIFSARLKDLHVQEEVAQPLSALIERGILNGGELQCALGKILKPLADTEALLLACTHYPAVAGEIQKILPKTRLLDPARATALEVAAEVQGVISDGEDEFFTSGEPDQMSVAGLKAFGVSFRAGRLPGALSL